MDIFIGCSSSEYIANKYLDDCREFLEKLFSVSNNLVFGVCDKGLMGLAHDVAFSNARFIKGICPLLYKNQFDLVNCNVEEITKTVVERTWKVINSSDVILFLPGGVGTIYELFSAIEWKRSYEIDKPIIIYNSLGHFDKMLEFLDIIYDEGFTSREIESCYYVCDNVDDAIEYINEYYEKNSFFKKRILGKK